MSRPQLVAVVMIDEPQGGEYYGGRVAAPVFAAIMREAVRLLNIAPDHLPDRTAPTMALQTAALGGALH